ncbi:bifunctional o-acetylhomoserine/o-acetylserine sulfhydrylase [Streptomyces luteoverticillatus]|uniref:Bifunctional o-acetylhomoserine/o-acetylserine sulfhydrylase n=1 Tax=Streptomyces luteoverticillatus TaxID=66425 RepID=A0A3Q9FZP4_STRLT|nr:bifunctional o-acetylhomoserine/o-acetylserine sulfhydrylase [Streptomyces luteoverticillatus]AZQ74438.1 bifunctional o-acetylhomoserine/o-acetylserine sulfhydrylase [Streptomyces luteoverticillatus]
MSVLDDAAPVTDGTPADPTRAWGFETKQIHAGHTPDPASHARALPIYQTTSYTFDSTAHAKALFSLEETGNVYTRIMNPTQDAIEQRIAALEGGVAALLLSSGQTAVAFAVLNLAAAGDHIVASPRLYGGSYTLFCHTLPRFGVTVSFVDDPDDPEQWRAAVRPNTKAFFGETISNPRNDVFDVEGVSAVAHEHGIPLIVDNTVATPYLIQPLRHGADVVVHSATKYLGGHGTTIAGAVIDGGTFDWTSGRFPNFTTPDPSYHGLVYAELGPPAYAVKARVSLLRDIGAAVSPFSAFMLGQGIETLSLRVQRHVENATAVAEFLAARPEVTSVAYAGLPTSPWYERARRLAPRGAGAVVAFEIAGGEEAATRFIDALTLHSHVANIGDVRSLVLHPATTSHAQLSTAEQLTAGVTPATVRLSVGLEAIDDILADLRTGFAAAAR